MDKEEIQNILKTLLEKLTVHCESIECVEGEIHPVFHIRTNDSGVLIGNNGENLRALNHIIKKIVASRMGDEQIEQFIVDINGYNRRRMEEIKNQASILAQRAKMFKSNVEMNPMNAYERMIVHSLFSDDSEIKTESEGEGRFRRIVFKYTPASAGQSLDSSFLS